MQRPGSPAHGQGCTHAQAQSAGSGPQAATGARGPQSLEGGGTAAIQDQRLKMRQALDTGDERFLPIRDKGPAEAVCPRLRGRPLQPRRIPHVRCAGLCHRLAAGPVLQRTDDLCPGRLLGDVPGGLRGRVHPVPASSASASPRSSARWSAAPSGTAPCAPCSSASCACPSRRSSAASTRPDQHFLQAPGRPDPTQNTAPPAVIPPGASVMPALGNRGLSQPARRGSSPAAG